MARCWLVVTVGMLIAVWCPIFALEKAADEAILFASSERFAE